MLIKTKGRARQKVMTLAKKAGAEVKAVVFTKKEAEEAIGYKLRGKLCTKNDTACGRAFQTSKAIWLSLPVSIGTIAEEVMHLVTKTSHSTASFQNRVVALQRGKCPATAKVRKYQVTVNSTRAYEVWELTAADAKKHYRRGQLLNTTETLTAKRIIPQQGIKGVRQ